MVKQVGSRVLAVAAEVRWSQFGVNSSRCLLTGGSTSEIVGMPTIQVLLEAFLWKGNAHGGENQSKA